MSPASSGILFSSARRDAAGLAGGDVECSAKGFTGPAALVPLIAYTASPSSSAIVVWREE